MCIHIYCWLYLEDNGESDEEEKGFNDGDKGNVIYILFLPLANVLLSIIIVHFTWGIIDGREVLHMARSTMVIKLTKERINEDRVNPMFGG